MKKQDIFPYIPKRRFRYIIPQQKTFSSVCLFCKFHHEPQRKLFYFSSSDNLVLVFEVIVHAGIVCHFC